MRVPPPCRGQDQRHSCEASHEEEHARKVACAERNTAPNRVEAGLARCDLDTRGGGDSGSSGGGDTTPISDAPLGWA